MKAYRVWCIWESPPPNIVDGAPGYETIASTAYELEQRAQDIADREAARPHKTPVRFEVRPEEVPGELRDSKGRKLYRTCIVVKGHDNKHTRFPL